MKKSFYIITIVIALVVSITAVGQIAAFLHSGIVTPRFILNSVLDCLYIFGVAELFLKKRWAPVLLSISLLISIISYLTNTNFSLETRIWASVIYLVIILLNILVYRQLKASPVQKQVLESEKRNYWILCYRNFTALAILAGLSLIVSLFLGAYVAAGIFFVVVAIFAIQARMYYKYSRKIIEISYILLGLSVFSSLIQNVLYPRTLGISSLLAYVVDAYLIYCVYKADKQKISM